MRIVKRLYRLLTHQTDGDKENTLIRKLLRHWGVYSLTGHSKWGLGLFLFRSARDIKTALDQDAGRTHIINYNPKEKR